MSTVKVGILAFVVIGVLAYFGFTKSNPIENPYQLDAVFTDANRLRARSPVRIAGVQVGEVTKVAPLANGRGLARVSMEILPHGLPVKKDATLKIRSRLFLEGNYFVDLYPGRPGSPEVASGHTIPVNQTAAPVRYADLLRSLQADTRQDIQSLLYEFSESLKGKGGRGFNEAIRNWEGAYKNTSQVNEAVLGEGEHDLTRVLKGQARVFGALSENEENLKALVTGLNRTLAAFASQEDNLAVAVPLIRDVLRDGRPALASLNRALPELRGFARDALPGARSSVGTLDAQIPLMRQLRRLVSRPELGGLSRDLRRTVPSLTLLNRRARLSFEQTRALASCQNSVILPFSKKPIPDPDFPWHTNEPYFEEQTRTLVGLAGESRLADANSSFFRVLGTGGPTTVAQFAPGLTEQALYSQQLLPIDSVRPVTPTQRPKFRPDIPCETQEVPDLHASAGPGDQTVQPSATKKASKSYSAKRTDAYERLAEYIDRTRAGKPALDPFNWSGDAERDELKRLGLERGENGKIRRARP